MSFRLKISVPDVGKDRTPAMDSLQPRSDCLRRRVVLL